jgi:hypothetical protein
MATTKNQKPNPVAPKPDQLSVNAERHTKAELARALFDVLDGNSSSSDIVYSTGLPRERAEEISKIFADLAKNV